MIKWSHIVKNQQTTFDYDENGNKIIDGSQKPEHIYKFSRDGEYLHEVNLTKTNASSTEAFKNALSFMLENKLIEPEEDVEIMREPIPVKRILMG